jgi:GntR family transcriptional regulator, transcriptional repressor for pyruvate dehydrogenase complex
VSTRRGRIPQQRIAETIAAELRERILAADDVGTYRLPTQEQLVHEFGVSYPSVREALRILETEGLVTVRRGNVGGAEVHRPDEASAAYHLGLVLQGGRVTLGDLAEALQQLEPQCAAACARRADRHETVVPALRANVDASADLVNAGPAFTHTARAFHDLVVQSTPNVTIRYVVGSLVRLWTAQEERWARSVAGDGYPSEGDTAQVVKAHRRILKAIEAGRSAEAERLARAHLTASQAYLVDRFDDSCVMAGAAKDRPGGLSGWRA